MAYSEKVMDHFNHPRNVGEMENPSGVGTVGNAKCGDIMRMYLDIDDNNPFCIRSWLREPANHLLFCLSYCFLLNASMFYST